MGIRKTRKTIAEADLMGLPPDPNTDCGPVIGQMQILNESIKQAGSVKTPCLIQLYGNSSDLGKIAENEKSETVTNDDDFGFALLWWAIRDSNPGPTGYEPVALTN